MNLFNRWCAVAVMALCTFNANAAGRGEAELETLLRGLYPATQFTGVRKTDIDGIFEVDMGKNIGYTNREGRLFIFGHIFDMKSQQDLTAQRLDALNVVDFTQLPLLDAIQTVRGNGSRKLALFSDPDCPYCKRLEAELLKLDNVTIYTFLYPLEGLHPDSIKKAKSIWCSGDKQKAWRDFMTGGGQLHEKTDCEHPIDRNLQLGQKLGINGTPTLIARDGRVMPGAASIEQIEKWLGKGGD